MMLAYSTSHCFLAGNKLGLCLGSEVLIFVLDLRKISKTYHLVTSHKRIYRSEISMFGYVAARAVPESLLHKPAADLSSSKRVYGQASR